MTPGGVVEIAELEQLRSRRTDCRLSHAEAALLSGVSVSTIKALEGPRGHITSKTLAGLCRGYALVLPGIQNQFQPVLDAALVKSVAQSLAPLMEVGDPASTRILLDYHSIVEALSVGVPPEESAVNAVLHAAQQTLPLAQTNSLAVGLGGGVDSDSSPEPDERGAVSVLDLDWARLGEHVVSRRVELGYRTREKFAVAADMSSRLLSDIENGNRDSYDRSTMARLDHALGWRAGTCTHILNGGEPNAASALTAKTANTGGIGHNIAANVRRLRLARGWSIARMAKECASLGYEEMTEHSLCNIERGQDPDAKRKAREVTAEELFMFAELLTTPIEVLVGRASCPTCNDAPPTGFTCNACGVTSSAASVMGESERLS